MIAAIPFGCYRIFWRDRAELSNLLGLSEV
jgi:hypothetical protein